MTTRTKVNSLLGKRLVRLRTNRPYLTQRKLAEQAGISVHLLSSLEQGRCDNPTLKTLVGLALALDTTVAELIHGCEEWYFS